MGTINKIFFRGLVTLLPIALTIYIMYSAILILENVLGSLLRALLPPSLYVPGLGVVATLSVIFMFGLALNNYVTKRVLTALEEKLNSIPLIKAIYSPVKDLMNLFSKNDKGGFNTVVLVKLPDNESLAMGLITRESFADLELENITQDRVAVFIPFSYGLGGYTFLVPRSRITKIDLPVEKALSLSITGWVKVQQKDESNL